MRVRAKHLLFAHHMLETWASWKHTHLGENGVMGALIASYSPHMPSAPTTSLVPKLDMPRDVSLVDREVLDAPKKHKNTIDIKYIKMGKVSRHAEDLMLEFFAGRLIRRNE